MSLLNPGLGWEGKSQGRAPEDCRRSTGPTPELPWWLEYRSTGVVGTTVGVTGLPGATGPAGVAVAGGAEGLDGVTEGAPEAAGAAGVVFCPVAEGVRRWRTWSQPEDMMAVMSPRPNNIPRNAGRRVVVMVSRSARGSIVAR